MKISNSVLDEVITEAAGEDVVALVHALKNKKNYSEFKLADSLKQEINTTRNMLYRLLKHNLVTFTRKKDKRKGWYIYYWTFNIKNVKYLQHDLKKQRVERLKERLERERSSNFFQCKNQCMRLSFDQANEFSYKCPECGDLLNQQDSTEILKSVEKQILDLQKQMKN